MDARPISLSLVSLDLADLLDGARALADAVSNRQLDDRDADKAPLVIAATVSAVAERLRALARVAQGTIDPSCLASPRVMASPPLDRNDHDIRIGWSPAQRATHLRRLLAQVESESPKRKNRRSAR
jgi:hypothetical protein